MLILWVAVREYSVGSYICVQQFFQPTYGCLLLCLQVAAGLVNSQLKEHIAFARRTAEAAIMGYIAAIDATLRVRSNGHGVANERANPTIGHSTLLLMARTPCSSGC